MKLLGPHGEVEVTVPLDVDLSQELGSLVLHGGGLLAVIDAVREGTAIWVSSQGYSAKFELPAQFSDASGDELRAPMTGKVIDLPFAAGEKISRGDTVAIIEAMKMEFRLEADRDGEVAELGARVGDLVDLGQLLVRIE